MARRLAFYGSWVSVQVVTLTQGPSWWHVLHSAEKDSGRLAGHTDLRLLSPCDLSQILVGGSW